MGVRRATKRLWIFLGDRTTAPRTPNRTRERSNSIAQTLSASASVSSVMGVTSERSAIILWKKYRWAGIMFRGISRMLRTLRDEHALSIRRRHRNSKLVLTSLRRGTSEIEAPASNGLLDVSLCTNSMAAYTGGHLRLP